MIEEEEYNALKQQVWERRNAAADSTERTATLVAVCDAAMLEDGCVDERFALQQQGQHVVGTCDVYAVRALPGEVLIGVWVYGWIYGSVCR